MLLTDIADKTILEAACGRTDFAISASDYAKDVFCYELS